MGMPSREFLVRQAVLNAAAICCPDTLDKAGTKGAVTELARWHESGGFFQQQAFKEVRIQFRKLVERERTATR